MKILFFCSFFYYFDLTAPTFDLFDKITEVIMKMAAPFGLFVRLNYHLNCSYQLFIKWSEIKIPDYFSMTHRHLLILAVSVAEVSIKINMHKKIFYQVGRYFFNEI